MLEKGGLGYSPYNGTSSGPRERGPVPGLSWAATVPVAVLRQVQVCWPAGRGGIGAAHHCGWTAYALSLGIRI